MARPTKHETRYKYVGRKSKMTEEVIKKLEEAASLRATVAESCFYADISQETYYTWMKKNPQLLERLKDLRQKPILLARQSIVLDIPRNVNTAFRFLEKEMPEDYGEKIKVEHSGSVEMPGEEHPEDTALRLEFKKRLVENIQKRAREKEAQKNENSN